MDLKIELNDDGSIHAIGYVGTYTYACPEFITPENYHTFKFLGGDINDRNNWTINDQN